VNSVNPRILPFTIVYQLIIATTELTLIPGIRADQVSVALMARRWHPFKTIEGMRGDTVLHREALDCVEHFREGVALGRAKFENRESAIDETIGFPECGID